MIDDNKYNLKFDVVRCWAITFVICIHCMGLMNEAIAKGYANCEIKSIWGGLNSIIYSGVPLFLMLSGALLLRKTEPISLFFNKRLKRILVPFLIWSFVVFVLKKMEEAPINIHEIPLLFLVEFSTVGTHGIYWYIYLIIGLYLVTPILRIFFTYADKKNIYYFGVLMILMTCVSKLFPEFMIFNRFSSLNLIYLTYFIMGHIINKYLMVEMSFTSFRKYAYIGLLLSVLGGSVQQIYGICSHFPWIFFTSMFLFFCIISASYNKISNRICQIISFVSSASYGIYLSHFMLISLFVKFGISSYIPLWIQPIFMTILVLLVDIFIMYIIKKIKFDKYLM